MSMYCFFFSWHIVGPRRTKLCVEYMGGLSAFLLRREGRLPLSLWNAYHVSTVLMLVSRMHIT